MKVAQKRARHAVERLTFGPRPGDVHSVATLGVDRWIELQLHPDRIEDNALELRLAPYRTLNTSTRDLVVDFPSYGLLKAAREGKFPYRPTPAGMPSMWQELPGCSVRSMKARLPSLYQHLR